MTNVKKYTNNQILDRVESLPTFKGWFKGKYDIWVRSDEDAFNVFDDKCYSFECKEEGIRPAFVMVCSGTTNAGAQGLLHFNEYNHLGCAVLKSDHIVYNSHIKGMHKKTMAYIQSFLKECWFPYFRDNDKDLKAEENGKEYCDRIGANCHPAGENSTQIGGWSTACLVRNIRKEFDKWMKYMNGDPLSVAILKEW